MTGSKGQTRCSTHVPCLPRLAEQRTGADRANGSRWLQDIVHGAAAHRGRSCDTRSRALLLETEKL